MNSKICKDCSQEKSISEFDRNGKYFRSWCKQCTSIRRKQYYQENKDKIREQQHRYMANPEVRKKKVLATKEWRKKNPDCRRKQHFNRLAKKFGYTPEQFALLIDGFWKEQDGKCAICEIKLIKHGKNGDGLSIDHNKMNNQVRGLLCKSCNFAIGLLNDSASNCFRAGDYLTSYLDR